SPRKYLEPFQILASGVAGAGRRSRRALSSMGAGAKSKGSAMTERIYLDWNATAPLRSEARAAALAALDVIGNPSSVHGEGRAARHLIEQAREQVAALVGA